MASILQTAFLDLFVNQYFSIDSMKFDPMYIV